VVLLLLWAHLRHVRFAQSLRALWSHPAPLDLGAARRESSRRHELPACERAGAGVAPCGTHELPVGPVRDVASRHAGMRCEPRAARSVL